MNSTVIQQLCYPINNEEFYIDTKPFTPLNILHRNHCFIGTHIYHIFNSKLKNREKLL